MRFRTKIVAFTVTLLGILAAGAAAQAESPYKFGPHDVQCQASPDQPKCVGSH